VANLGSIPRQREIERFYQTLAGRLPFPPQLSRYAFTFCRRTVPEHAARLRPPAFRQPI